MKLAEIGESANAVRGQLRAGIPLVEAVDRMQLLQPKHEDFWSGAARELQGGSKLSELLAQEWPDSLVAALRAGEESGSVEAVLAQIKQTVDLQLSVGRTASQLYYPAGVAVAAVVVFVFFMVAVLPGLAKTIPSAGKNPMFQVAAVMEGLAKAHGLLILLGLGIGVSLLVSWLRSPAGRDALFSVALQIPGLRTAVATMAFGLWAKYLAVSTGAGIPTLAAIAATSGVLPGELRQSVEVFAQDLSLRNKSMREAADLRTLPADDLRVKWWPFYVSTAWMLAEQTGVVAEPFLTISPELMDRGEVIFKRAVGVANIAAMLLAGALITTPLAAYYIEMFSSLSKVR